MKRVILKKLDTSVRLSGKVIKFITPVVQEIELTEEEYLEYEGQLMWLLREGIVDVVESKQEQNVVQEEIKGQVKGKKVKKSEG